MNILLYMYVAMPEPNACLWLPYPKVPTLYLEDRDCQVHPSLSWTSVVYSITLFKPLFMLYSSEHSQWPIKVDDFFPIKLQRLKLTLF